jgi:DNA polymerase V
LFADLASCGFPSPAADYVESDLDLHDYCIRPERDLLSCQR